MRVLFLGEGDLDGPARYLSAILTWSGIRFDHQPDQSRLPKAWCRKKYDVVVLSDYRCSSFTPSSREWLTRSVEAGTGLLMIGGWASYTGLVGGYAGSAIERLLPVTCMRGDDRVQQATGALLLHSGKSQQGDSPMVCGYHRAIPKPNSQTTMVFRDVLYRKGRLALGETHPALVLGAYGHGRTAAFLTDCAPHWAGGLVDWGPRRVAVSLGHGISVEVGNLYLKFFRQLLHWTAQI